jgi:urease accessory protein
MRSRVVVAAVASAHGATVLRTMVAEGAFALRRTGPAEVHLVGTAAGPIGDDEVDIEVCVDEGARLVMRGVAAAIALAAPDGGTSRLDLRARVGADAALDLSMPPLIVTRDAHVVSRVAIHLDESSRLDLTERVCLGRHDEDGGQWRGRVTLDVAGRPALRQSQHADGITTALGSGVGVRRGALVTRLTHDALDTDVDAAVAGRAFLVPLGGGTTLRTAVGTDLAAALVDLSALLTDRDVADLGSAHG